MCMCMCMYMHMHTVCQFVDHMCCRYDFESWREFSYLDENNAQAAERSARLILCRHT